MSALSALASYDVSDDEGGDENNESVNEEKEQAIERKVTPAQDKELTGDKTIPTVTNNLDEEDIWRNSDEEEFRETEATDDNQNQAEADTNDNERSDSINIGDLSSIRDESGNEQSDDDSHSSEGEGDTVGGLVNAMKVTVKRRNKRRSSENATNLAKKLRSASVDEVSVPPEPEGRCSGALQDKIKRFMERKVKDGEDLNKAIQARKDFRNPSIYEKLIVYLGIDELGTNFPQDDYNPKTWRKAPAYDELARAQREDMAKREKERKTKVEFVTGTVKKPSSTGSAQASSDAVKKSKWDQQSSSKSGSIDKGSGHKTTVISAIGSIKKPKV